MRSKKDVKNMGQDLEMAKAAAAIGYEELVAGLAKKWGREADRFVAQDAPYAQKCFATWDAISRILRGMEQ